MNEPTPAERVVRPLLSVRRRIDATAEEVAFAVRQAGVTADQHNRHMLDAAVVYRRQLQHILTRLSIVNEDLGGVIATVDTASAQVADIKDQWRRRFPQLAEQIYKNVLTLRRFWPGT